MRKIKICCKIHNKSSSESNPMKLVKTTSLPTKHEFASDHSKENTEKWYGVLQKMIVGNWRN